MSDVTHLLDTIDGGDPHAPERLLPLVYEELRRLAAQKMAREPPGQTLQPTALVHEAWLRLVGDEALHFKSRAHFLGAAAEAMRRILIDNARRKHRARHGQGLVRVALEEVQVAAQADDQTLLNVDEALEKLAAKDPLKARLVKLRFFLGLSLAEAAQALGLSKGTAKRHWAYARAWLYDALRSSS